MNQLREACEHGRWEAHVDVLPCPGHFADWPKDAQMSCTVRHESHCPGGQLVPADARMVSSDALVIEKVNGEWPEWITDVDGPIWHQCGSTYGLLDDIFDDLAERAKTSEPPPKDPWDYDP